MKNFFSNKKYLFIGIIFAILLISSFGGYKIYDYYNSNKGNPKIEDSNHTKGNDSTEKNYENIDEEEVNDEEENENNPTDNKDKDTSSNNEQKKDNTQPKQTNKYVVSFNSNGGSGISSQTINENNLASRPSNPTKLGYIFDGWNLNGSSFNFNTPITTNITLVANWKIDPTPEWAGQVASFSTKSECQAEAENHYDDYVPQCDDIYNVGGILLGWQLMLTKKNSNPLEQWIWRPNGNWIRLN